MINRKISYLVGVVLLTLATYCCTNEAAIQRGAHDGQELFDTISVLDDPTFSHGLALRGVNTGDQQFDKLILPFGGDGQSARWSIAEWGSRHPLSGQSTTRPDGEIVYANDGKTLGFKKGRDGMEFRLEVLADKEYDKPREEGVYWPHLLLEQAFRTPVRLSEVQGISVQLDAKLLFSELKMPESAFDPGLHSAQFQLFVTLTDVSPESEGNGDFLWFGFSLYDYRYRDVPAYMAEDIGKDDASGKYIYMLSSVEMIEGSMHDGEWVSVNKDLYEGLVASFYKAQEKGYLRKSNLEDMALTSLNIGWENTATVNSGVVFRNFDVKKTVIR